MGYLDGAGQLRLVPDLLATYVLGLTIDSLLGWGGGYVAKKRKRDAAHQQIHFLVQLFFGDSRACI